MNLYQQRIQGQKERQAIEESNAEASGATRVAVPVAPTQTPGYYNNIRRSAIQSAKDQTVLHYQIRSDMAAAEDQANANRNRELYDWARMALEGNFRNAEMQLREKQGQDVLQNQIAEREQRGAIAGAELAQRGELAGKEMSLKERIAAQDLAAKEAEINLKGQTTFENWKPVSLGGGGAAAGVAIPGGAAVPVQPGAAVQPGQQAAVPGQAAIPGQQAAAVPGQAAIPGQAVAVPGQAAIPADQTIAERKQALRDELAKNNEALAKQNMANDFLPQAPRPGEDYEFPLNTKQGGVIRNTEKGDDNANALRARGEAIRAEIDSLSEQEKQEAQRPKEAIQAGGASEKLALRGDAGTQKTALEVENLQRKKFSEENPPELYESGSGVDESQIYDKETGKVSPEGQQFGVLAQNYHRENPDLTRGEAGRLAMEDLKLKSSEKVKLEALLEKGDGRKARLSLEDQQAATKLEDTVKGQEIERLVRLKAGKTLTPKQRAKSKVMLNTKTGTYFLEFPSKEGDGLRRVDTKLGPDYFENYDFDSELY